MILLFTPGQELFALIFAFAFVIALGFAYRKDFKYLSIFYDKPYWVWIGMIAFILLIISIFKK